MAPHAARCPSRGRTAARGHAGNGTTIGPAQITLDRAPASAVASLAPEVEATPETINRADILDVGHGFSKSFLTTERTLRHFREDLWIPQLLSRVTWEASGSRRSRNGRERRERSPFGGRSRPSATARERAGSAGRALSWRGSPSFCAYRDLQCRCGREAARP
jgi:hypothetical protein